MSAPLTVTIVGHGRVGQALGTNLVRLGHTVRYATRSAQGDDLPTGATSVPIEGSAHHADLVVLAVPFAAVNDVVPRLGLSAAAILIDATNPFGQPVPGGHHSGAEVVAGVSRFARTLRRSGSWPSAGEARTRRPLRTVPVDATITSGSAPPLVAQSW